MAKHTDAMHDLGLVYSLKAKTETLRERQDLWEFKASEQFKNCIMVDDTYDDGVDELRDVFATMTGTEVRLREGAPDCARSCRAALAAIPSFRPVRVLVAARVCRPAGSRGSTT